jgi:[glutamine synthetase] adenylyltransferase / [glutamine synthetase]-adenylyl-L-tyrosine phosphorylase
MPDTLARLLDDAPSPAALALLRRQGVADPERAARELRALAPDRPARAVLARLLPSLVSALATVPDPDAALLHLERFVRASGGGAAVLAVLHDRGAESLELLLSGLGSSPFLADALVRHPEWAGWLSERHALAHASHSRDLADEIRRAVAEAGPGGARDALRRLRRREILRLALRDLRRLTSVEETLVELSALADALVRAALEVATAEVRAEGRLPPLGSEGRAGFAVLALGKLGGSELNFSSDVDLVYLHRTDAGRVAPTRGAPTRHAYAEALARRLTAVLAETSHEGHVYRVDLRLRPEGRAGAISDSLRAADDYYRTRGAAWERLALIKARPVAGDDELGRALLRRVAPFVWGGPFDGHALGQVLRMKHESDRRLAARGLGERHVKLGRGGIREIELVTQVLQLRSSGRSGLRARATLEALAALRDAGALPSPEAEALSRAYLFLRDVENKLQMVHDSQTHVLPADDEELRLLARRLGYADGPEALRFASDLAGHTQVVHRLFEELLVRPASGGSAR